MNSPATIGRRWTELGLHASSKTDSALPLEVKRNLVVDEVLQDPAGLNGPRCVKREIARKHGIHLKRSGKRK